jgi:DNA-binding GntR family transcriptional regulator
MSISLVTKPVAGIPRQSLASIVTDKLREKIICGRLKEGERLLQNAIAKGFRVSRIPVRQALCHLQAEGLIELVANHGAFVSTLGPAEIEQGFETRAVLECFILRHAVPNFTDVDFQTAYLSLDKYERFMEAEPAASCWGEWDWAFHSPLYARANRPVAMSTLKALKTNCNRYYQMMLLLTGNIHYTSNAHRTLVDVFRARDVEMACNALWQHVMDESKLVTEFIKRRAAM